MYIKPTEEQIKEAIEEGWSEETATRGYDIFDYDNTGLLQIERIDDIFWDSDVTDEDCAREAVKTGFCKIIPVEELPKDFFAPYYIWVDTEENRKKIKEY